MPLAALSTAPALISPEDYDEQSAATPNSFDPLPPVLRFKLESVACGIQNGNQEQCQNVQTGTLWVTET